MCPGYLVTRTDTENINILQENWTAHSLVSPPHYKIITVGLSQPCTMAPFTQVNQVILSSEKHTSVFSVGIGRKISGNSWEYEFLF